MAIGTARQTQYQQVHYIRRKVQFNTSGISAGVIVGTLPAGAKILNTAVAIQTAFNAATTNVMNIGTAAAGAQVMPTATIIPGTIGGKNDPTTGLALAPLAVDTDIFVTYTQTGTAATTGSADIIVTYAVDNDQ